MLRSLSNKLLLAVVLAVALPFAGFALFLDHEITDRLALEFARATLRGLATDLAAGVDREVDERVGDLESWAREPLAGWALGEGAFELDGALPAVDAAAFEQLTGGAGSFREVYEGVLDGYLERKQRFDLIALLDERGVPLVVGQRGAAERRSETIAALTLEQFHRQPWFTEALAGGVGRIGQGRFDSWLGRTESDEPPRYHVGLAVQVRARTGEQGVLLALVNWSAFESLIEAPLVKDAFRGFVSGGATPSPYAWIWGTDGDTIIAHRDRTLYGEHVSGPRVGLPGMVEDVLADDVGGLYRPYTFNGVRKNAAFAWTAGRDEGGFGWVVGVGIDNADVERATRGVSAILVRGTIAVLVVVVAWAVMIARRTVAPIRALERHTQRVAEGDLDARIRIDTGDEVAQLARAFNRMTAELSVQSERLVKAEKDAAWREMARQIAHDLKNPLTPIQLSLDLEARARSEEDPRADAIAARSLDMIRRQVEHLREIATGFYEFTGGAKPVPRDFDLSELVREIVELYADHATELGISIDLETEPAPVHADRAKLRRAVTNLISNGLEAMPDGGPLTVRCGPADGPAGRCSRLDVTDRGVGLSPQAQARLFEPYFTSKSGGTGLGLAIARRVVDEAGGELSLVERPAEEGTGCRARLDLPLAAKRGTDGDS
ncbi:ATP-binding protein [Planctomycetes bacterium Pla163]